MGGGPQGRMKNLEINPMQRRFAQLEAQKKKGPLE
jgi:hypothetical protein